MACYRNTGMISEFSGEKLHSLKGEQIANVFCLLLLTHVEHVNEHSCYLRSPYLTVYNYMT